MDVSFSESVYNRLPSAIQGLDLTHQKVYIHLRIGKREDEIARLLGIHEDDVMSLIIKVRESLTRAGLLYLIEEPRFTSIHYSGPDDEEQEIQFPTGGLPIDKKLIINEFLKLLRKAIDGLPHHQSRLLNLRYKQQMSAKEILGFSKKIKTSFIPDKTATELNEQDIFYALNTAIKEVLRRLRESYREESFLCTDNLKYILEEIDI